MPEIDITDKSMDQILTELYRTIEAPSDEAREINQNLPVDQSCGQVDMDLIRLTILIEALTNAENHGGGLGGTYGYGITFQNAVFGMKPYCWCERLDCPWCTPCSCEEEYLIDGIVTPYEVWERRKDAVRAIHSSLQWNRVPGFEWRVPNPCRWHLPDSPDPAPNFWHVASNTRIRWYKWIGRDTEIEIPDGVSWSGVYRECVQSIPRLPYELDPTWIPT